MIVHRIGPESDWAEVIKIKNPNIPSQLSGEPFSVRLSQLRLIRRTTS